MDRKLCTGCHRYRHISRFRKASADFPAPAGRQCCCRDCTPDKPVYRLEESAGPFRKIERITEE